MRDCAGFENSVGKLTPLNPLQRMWLKPTRTFKIFHFDSMKEFLGKTGEI